MKEVISYIAKALVDHPEEVNIQVEENDHTITYWVTVSSSDVGKVIGKNGKTIKSFQTLMTSLSVNEKKRIQIKITRDQIAPSS
jgi:predicted RNA-binding protein YlqC (UPF0109 family)